jgi:predicted molibdopterin-dependent oxidoreductase YjgC
VPRAFLPLEQDPLETLAAQQISFDFEGETVSAAADSTLANALLVHGISTFRFTASSGSARGPFCLMGACYDCLVMVDERENQQACMTVVRAGMQVQRMRGAARIAARDVVLADD